MRGKGMKATGGQGERMLGGARKADATIAMSGSMTDKTPGASHKRVPMHFDGSRTGKVMVFDDTKPKSYSAGGRRGG